MERRLLALAAKQSGYATRRQLVDLGLPATTIDHRVRAGWYVAAHAGVYAIGPRRDDPIARAAAALLAGGPDAVLSHGSAASLWGIKRRWEFPVEVTLTAGDRRPPGIRTHRSRTLARVDIRRHLGIRVTSPARTLLAIAPRTPDKALARMLNDARRGGYVHLATLTDLLARCPNHPGTAKLKAFVAQPHGPTRSEFEDAFVAFADRYDLPTPLVNTRVNGYELDALFAAQKLIVELDGWEFHNDRTAFADDRERDSEMLKSGYATMRVTWERLRDTPGREAARLREILSARR